VEEMPLRYVSKQQRAAILRTKEILQTPVSKLINAYIGETLFSL
jgi:hypothetical protein